MVNAVALTIVCFFIVREAIGRLQNPPSIDGVPVIIVGFVGLIVNLIAVKVLHGDAQHSLNIRGAYLEVLSDTLASVAVIVSAFLMLQQQGCDASASSRPLRLGVFSWQI